MWVWEGTSQKPFEIQTLYDMDRGFTMIFYWGFILWRLLSFRYKSSVQINIISPGPKQLLELAVILWITLTELLGWESILKSMWFNHFICTEENTKKEKKERERE